MVTRALLLACLPTVGCGLIANLGDVHFDPSDTGVAPTDTSLGDTFTTDTSLGDTFVSDTFVPDTFVPDTFVADVAEVGPPPCKTGTTSGTSEMARIDGPKGSYCIDVNEVTVAQMESYDGKVLSAPPALPTRCAGKWDRWYKVTGADPQEPAINVNWCQAWSYCNWAGKRLCRGIDGTKLATDNGELSWVCQNGADATNRPYGNGYLAGSCDVESGRTTPIKITTTPACHGTKPPYDAVYNLVGSVEEWSDECPDTTHCWARGGYFGNVSNDATCSTITNYLLDSQYASLGFRCCK